MDAAKSINFVQQRVLNLPQGSNNSSSTHKATYLQEIVFEHKRHEERVGGCVFHALLSAHHILMKTSIVVLEIISLTRGKEGKHVGVIIVREPFLSVPATYYPHLLAASAKGAITAKVPVPSGKYRVTWFRDRN